MALNAAGKHLFACAAASSTDWAGLLEIAGRCYLVATVMILKAKDSLQDAVEELENALRKPLPTERRKLLEKDLAVLRAGEKGEKEAAYHIDFDLKDSSNWAVIHDLRIEWNARVAQIDHLLINRLLEIYVVESKSFRTKVRYYNGGWQRLNFNHWAGIPSPVEQNERHIAVLKELIEQRQVAPTRLGMAMSPRFLNVVAIHPSCSISGKIPEGVSIFHMDTLMKKIRAQDPSALSMFKVIGTDTLQRFAERLVQCHIPAPKRQVPAAPESETSPTAKAIKCSTGQACQSCGGPLTNAEAHYCRINASQFANQLLCRKCQSYTGNAAAGRASIKVAASIIQPPEIAANCAICGTGVDKKVVAFCRFNSQRFEKRILCRACQSSGAGS